MTVHSLTPMLRVPDVAKSLSFYVEVLGFTCARHEQQWDWARLVYDGAEIMLSGLNVSEGDAAPSFTGSLYLRVDDLDALWERVKDVVKVCYSPETFAYGMREFAIYDGDGYLLQFGQDLTSA